MPSDRASVLIVDDDDVLREVLAETLGRGGEFDLSYARDGMEALSMAVEAKPDLMVLDVNMPGLGGLEVCSQLKGSLASPATRIILLTARGALEDIEAGLAAGADGYIVKPFSPRALLYDVRLQLARRHLGMRPANVRATERASAFRTSLPSVSVESPDATPSTGQHLLTRQMVMYAADLCKAQSELQTTYLGTLRAMAAAIDARDPYTNRHAERVAAYAMIIAQTLGLGAEESEALRHAALLHDLGKIGIPDAILLKPGPLTIEEMAVVKKHPDAGWRMLRDIPFLEPALPGILYHHERYDGRGYPSGLMVNQIPAPARLIAVADGFDAMTSTRSYRPRSTPEAARAEIRAGAGTQYSPYAVGAFESAYESLCAWIADNPDAHETDASAAFGALEVRAS